MLLGLVTSRPSCPRVLAEWNNGYSLAVPWPGGFTDQETPYNTTHLGLNLQRCVNKQLNTQRRAWLAACRSPLGALALRPCGPGASAVLCDRPPVGWASGNTIALAARVRPCPQLSRAPPAGGAARSLSCCSATPAQYSARAGLQVARMCLRMPAAGVLKAYCQGGLLALPPPSCWVLHVRGL